MRSTIANNPVVPCPLAAPQNLSFIQPRIMSETGPFFDSLLSM
jgi:hypothetical protein